MRKSRKSRKRTILLGVGIGLLMLLAAVAVWPARHPVSEVAKEESTEEETVQSTDETEEEEEIQAEQPEEEEALESSQQAEESTTVSSETSESETAAKTAWIAGQHRDPNSAVVVIDPGHQGSGNSQTEPNGPGSTVMKARVTSGTRGTATGVAEYVLTLDISLKLKTELENRGYTVYMTRTTHDVDISNMERAQYATTVGADIAVRIHANGSTNTSVNGAEALAPSTSNPYVSHLSAASQSLAQSILNAYCTATGFRNRGVILNDTMTGMNWSEVPVTILELGYMTNSQEDIAMEDETMKNNMVQGIANGIDHYFGF